ncbi:hypothetical protein BDF20DRAFT_998468 [Mycotypha africana]|uniref:uncharacterized protein n=1 Tax=Mycotypha africana TaxID=64632 RepID=UPI0023008CA9|nr:uncharacterized protein BDF20DRAFT_998468 [Mycotypha africana]KAI8987925.1 hypothetical protein BDF20DRAFT_998468 [Mycotypha africana]
MFKFLILQLCVLIAFVSAGKTEQKNAVDIESPFPGDVFVAGSSMPVILNFNFLATALKMDVSIYFKNLTMNLEIAKSVDTRSTGRKQIDFVIPNTVSSGDYRVEFVDAVNKLNFDIPILVLEAAEPSSANPTGGKDAAVAAANTANEANHKALGAAPSLSAVSAIKIALSVSLLVAYMQF